MPKGKELEQLPLSNIAPGAGKDLGKHRREVLNRPIHDEKPKPGHIEGDDLIKKG